MASTLQAKHDKFGAYVGGGILFTATRQNTPDDVVWHFYNAGGSVLLSGSAADFVAAAPTYYTSTDNDHLTVTAAGVAANIAAHGGAFGFEVVVGSALDRATIQKVQDGADGSNGIPGPPGPNGEQSYVHFAWANAADGSSGFSTTVSAGKSFIGVYSDFIPADSTNPSAYHWSPSKGADGANGTPGPPGANGQPTYVHIAYATAADGSTGFHVSDPTGRTYIGVYVDFTVPDSTNPADYAWSLIKGADGSPGAPGAPGAPGTPALSVSTSPASITVPCTAAGTPKAAIPGSQITAYSGTTPVTASASYSFTSSGVTGAAVTSGGAVSITGMVADHGYVEVTVSYGGASQIVKVTYDKTFDGAPYVYDTTAVGAPATTSYATVASISLLMGPNGSITMDTNGGFEINAGTINVLGTLEYSLNGGGSWTNANSFTGNAAPPFSQGDWSAGAGLSGATIGLTTRQTVMFRVTMRKNNTNNFAAFGGDFAVSWSA